MSDRFDAIIIGAGQAGPALAARLDREGWRIALVERHLIGGTCVNVGCIPTKTLIASARAAQTVRRAAEFGVLVDGPGRVDMARVKARKDAIVGAANRGVTDWLEGLQRVTLIRGHARFDGPHRVLVGDRVLSADRIFINAGARARVPDLPGLDRVAYWTNSSIMEVDFLPEHLLVVGGSYIGLEFAQMYRRFGSRVTVLEMAPRLIAREDEDVSAAVREILEGEGIAVRVGAECVGFEPDANGVCARIECDDDAEPVRASHLLLAVGRVPNTDDLGLAAAGIETDEGGFVVVDDGLRTSVPGVWALGEVNGRGAFTHTAYNDYEVVAAELFGPDSRRVSDRIPCYGLFIDPPLGRVGMTEREVRASGRRALVGRRKMSQVGRAREFGETRGFMKILVDADSDRLLGAAILGLSGDEVVHGLLDVMYAGQAYGVLARAVHIHPTVSELVPTVLQALRPLEAAAD